MSCRKTKGLENIENLCPTTRKRAKAKVSSGADSKNNTATNSPLSPWLVVSENSESIEKNSAKGLSPEYLEEMGIGLLESEESSSSGSASGIIATKTTASGDARANADENSNEATPNLDAPKLKRHPQSKVSQDSNQSPDTTTDCLKNSSYMEKQQSYNSNNNNVSASSFSIYTDEETADSKLNITTGSHFNSSLANTSRRTMRSPLAPVACNSQTRVSFVQQQSSPSISAVAAVNANKPGGSMNNDSKDHPRFKEESEYQLCSSVYSPSKPSTSRQAQEYSSYVKQQERQQKMQPVQQGHSKAAVFGETTSTALNQNDFFVFRQEQTNCDDLLGAGSKLLRASTQQPDYFNLISDEIILHIFKWLPKKALLRCASVSRRFSRCASDESLWARLDLGGRTLKAGAMGNILTHGVVILRLAQATINSPIVDELFLKADTEFESKLQYLDLSMATISKPSLKLVLSHCRLLKKLSLEHVPVNDEICNEIAKNTQLEALNMTMCLGLEAWSIRTMLQALQHLSSFNISWTCLSVDAVTSLVTNVTPNLMRLNVAGCRKTMFNSHLATLVKRCPQLLELDLSDCTGLTGEAITILCQFKMLEYLSLSRCYLIPASAYMELHYLKSLSYLDVFGALSDAAMEMLRQSFPKLGLNHFVHSSVARPTVGTRRTSIWGLRTRD